MPRSGSWGQISILVLSPIPMGRQQFYGSGIKPTIRRKSKKSCKNNDSATENHQFIIFFLIFKSMSWKERQPQTALICQITVGLSDLDSHLHMDKCSCSILEVPLCFTHSGFALRSQSWIETLHAIPATPGNAGSLLTMCLKYCMPCLRHPREQKMGKRLSEFSLIILLEHFLSVHFLVISLWDKNE